MKAEFLIVCKDDEGRVVDSFVVNPVTANARLALEQAVGKMRVRDCGHGDAVVSVTVVRTDDVPAVVAA